MSKKLLQGKVVKILMQVGGTGKHENYGKVMWDKWPMRFQCLGWGGGGGLQRGRWGVSLFAAPRILNQRTEASKTRS